MWDQSNYNRLEKSVQNVSKIQLLTQNSWQYKCTLITILGNILFLLRVEKTLFINNL